jgi:hypothetical protein
VSVILTVPPLDSEKFHFLLAAPRVQVRLLPLLMLPLLVPSVQWTVAPEELVTTVVLSSVKDVTLELELQLR